MDECRYAVVGVDDVNNFRLAQIVRKIRGQDRVSRFLELGHVDAFLNGNAGRPIVICLDLLGYRPEVVIEMIGNVRDAHPKAVFSLYVDKEEYRARIETFPLNWQDRLSHYYKIYKESPETEIEPIIRASLRNPEWEAMHNLTNEPIRLTPVFEKGLVEPVNQTNGLTADGPIAFVSYSRNDWNGFVSGLVADLSRQSQQVWVDQDFIVGGDDWMDAIGQALQACDSLLLVLSPDAINSKYVKMEYRYFFNQEKPIIPILYRKVDRLPFELATQHYIDFTHRDRTKSYRDLLNVLSRARSRN
jgi:hypothetical protein